MADNENTAKPSRGVIVEFDFTAIDGSALLFDTAKKVLSRAGVELDIKLEAKHLVGGNYQGAIAELAETVGKKLDSSALAKELSEEFAKALAAAAPGAVTAGFKAFVDALLAKDLKVVIATRVDREIMASALDGYDPAKVVVHCEPFNTYGNCKWDAWRRICSNNSLVDVLTACVTGSGKGVKAVLVAGMSAAAIIHDHVAYQDFGGADVLAEKFSAGLAEDVLRMLHM